MTARLTRDEDTRNDVAAMVTAECDPSNQEAWERRARRLVGDGARQRTRSALFSKRDSEVSRPVTNVARETVAAPRAAIAWDAQDPTGIFLSGLPGVIRNGSISLTSFASRSKRCAVDVICSD